MVATGCPVSSVALIRTVSGVVGVRWTWRVVGWVAWRVMLFQAKGMRWVVLSVLVVLRMRGWRAASRRAGWRVWSVGWVGVGRWISA
ncbi:hypothetical protein NEH16_31670 [Streptomyces drozdowiczii]|uniref:Uncharacterized protein n=1 Tax=Streptomyces drozdowiczii TaxID=202862 RepID=A0ABY6Q0R6_9ACTN|nr:hypothetical protein [Streptomyces drozdowiczii]UZK58032.1 hypothetical protein NEH16_31670 [Streptomyces drozdowiczii]